jgi:hypothetical protein
VLVALVASRWGAGAQTNSAAAGRGFAVQPPFIAPATPQSNFRLPKSLAEGRNPFFPQSTRHLGAEAVTKSNVVVMPTADLTLKGISGTPEQPLAIINNQTFTAGETGDVTTLAGKIRILCVEINMAAGTVLVQVGGQRRELRLSPK